MEEKFRMELLAILNKGMDKEQINAVDMALTALFQRYEVSEQCTDLVVLDDCNDKIINTYIASMRLEGRSEKTLKQYYDALTKLLEEIPQPDIVILMGCNVSCPHLTARHTENWGLEDPTGCGDAAYEKVIRQIHEKVLDLRRRLEEGLMLQ